MPSSKVATAHCQLIGLMLYRPTPRTACLLNSSPLTPSHCDGVIWWLAIGHFLCYVSGTVTLASLLQMVQLAHSSIQQYYQRQQRGPVTLQQREQAISRPGTACGTDEQLPGWQVLAPLLAWPCSTGNSSRHGHRGTGLRCWAPISWQSQDQTSATSQDDVSSRQTADTNSACSDRSRSAGLWPGLLQHLVGLVFAVLLMVYQHQLLQLTATAGGALQHRVFQPHIDWLREAHPGVSLGCTAAQPAETYTPCVCCQHSRHQ